MEPARNMSAWSMCEAPAIIACTNVNTLRPGRAPPTLPTNFTVASINVSNPSRCDNVATSNSPASATRFGSSKVTSMRSMLCDTRVTGSASCAGQLRRRRTPSLSQLRRPFWWIRGTPQPRSIGGSRFRERPCRSLTTLREPPRRLPQLNQASTCSSGWALEPLAGPSRPGWWVPFPRCCRRSATIPALAVVPAGIVGIGDAVSRR